MTRPQLHVVDESTISALMSWNDDAQGCRDWGGPEFRYPFTRQTFVEDAGLDSLFSRALLSPRRDLLAFGQLYEKWARIHLSRLIVNPARRCEGYGGALISALLDEGLRNLQLEQTSLWVYKYNSSAVNCYRKLGYRVTPPEDEDSRFEGCLFMVATAADVLARVRGNPRDGEGN